MKHKTLSLRSDFEVAFAVRDVQAAEMTLAPGGNTGGPDNRHRGAINGCMSFPETASQSSVVCSSRCGPEVC